MVAMAEIARVNIAGVDNVGVSLRRLYRGGDFTETSGATV